MKGSWKEFSRGYRDHYENSCRGSYKDHYYCAGYSARQQGSAKSGKTPASSMGSGRSQLQTNWLRWQLDVGGGARAQR